MTSSTKYDVELTITLTEAPGAADYEFVLLGSGGEVSEGSTLPDPARRLPPSNSSARRSSFPCPGRTAYAPSNTVVRKWPW
ncbi:hypothetical protein AHiyo8_29420 [Arthrobacter sp. Hiyo8]|nr:hypothetical protein AHiyo8_29420 [Arthrobacter sp. Hiyo8]